MRRRILIAVICAVVAAVALGSIAFGWRPGSILIRPSLAQCRDAAMGNKPDSIKVSWVWASRGFGWGCRYTFPDGSTGTATISVTRVSK